MKNILLIIILITLCGCTGAPNFTNDTLVREKCVEPSGKAIYVTSGIPNENVKTTGRSGLGIFNIYGRFKAPQNFAKVGDIIGIRNNTIKVIKK